MKTSLANLTNLGALALALSAASAHATISFSVGGVGPMHFPGPVTPPAGSPHVVDGWGYPGDTVTLAGAGGSFDLVNGASYTLKINTLLWGVDYTYNGTTAAWDYPANWPDLTFPIDATRSITMGSATASISQAGTLKATWSDDYLSFASGTTASLYVEDSGQVYRVDVTPIALPAASVNSFNGSINPPEGGFTQTPRDMMATFEVTAVPEPTSLLAGALLLLPFGMCALQTLRGKQAT